MKMKNVKFFSIVEVFCVLFIIGVLASFVSPYASRARESAYRVDCANNLNQIGKTLINYAVFNRNYIADYNWIADESMRDSYLCPKDDSPTIMDFNNGKGSIFYNVHTSYGINLSAYGKKVTNADGDMVVAFDAVDLTDAGYQPPDNGPGSGNNGNNGNNGGGNNGHGNNEDGVDSSNPGKSPKHGEDTSDEDDEIRDNGRQWSEEYGTYGGSTPGSSYPEVFGNMHPNDANRWYYQNLKFRHLDTACQLLLDGSVLIVKKPSDISNVIYRYDPDYDYQFTY
jgi:type II secretory pathway pseudopilin PulG